MARSPEATSSTLPLLLGSRRRALHRRLPRLVKAPTLVGASAEGGALAGREACTSSSMLPALPEDERCLARNIPAQPAGEVSLRFDGGWGDVCGKCRVIVDCAAYVDGRRVAGPLALEEVSSWLNCTEAFVWLGLRMPDGDEMADVSKVFGLDDLDVDAAVSPHRRPVLDRVNGATWLVLRTAQYHDKLERLLLGELCVLFAERFLITVRYGQASPLDGVRRELEADPDELRLGVPAVLARLLERVVGDYGPALDGFESDVIEIEEEVFSESRHRPTQRLYRLKRQILDLLIVTDALHDPVERLLRSHPLLQEPSVQAELTRTVEQLARMVTRTQILVDLLATAVDANMTQVSLQQNDDMRKISAWVAIAAVPTMVAGIYGMNFEHMPELETPVGYPLVLSLMAVTCILLYRAFRRSGWL